MELVRAARRMAHAMEVDDDVEDIIVALTGNLHMARTVAASPAIFLYLALDRRDANLAVARLTLKQVEASIKV